MYSDKTSNRLDMERLSAMELSIFLVILVVHFASGVLEEKRILVNDQDFTQKEINNLQTAIQDLQSKLTSYQNDLSITKNELSATKSQLAAQALKVSLQETKITKQEQTILALEQKVQYQERNITDQQNKVLNQQTVIKSITTNLTSVMLHNFEDEMAQAMCSSNTDQDSYVYAIRRNCNSEHALMCSNICTNAAASYSLGDGSHSHSECFDAFNIQKIHNHLANNQPEEGKPFMFVYRYVTDGCRSKYCGPNYCCCRAKH